VTSASNARLISDVSQWKTLIAFIKVWCEREQDGQRVFTAALNRYQTLDQFEAAKCCLCVDLLPGC
jgi:hypothetical protein